MRWLRVLFLAGVICVSIQPGLAAVLSPSDRTAVSNEEQRGNA